MASASLDRFSFSRTSLIIACVVGVAAEGETGILGGIFDSLNAADCDNALAIEGDIE